MIKVDFPKDGISPGEHRRMLDGVGELLGSPEAGSIGKEPAARRVGDWLLGKADAAMADGVEALLGRGHGSTPSGDDFLLGCCAALYTWGEAYRDIAGRLMDCILRRAPEATTSLSLAYLDYGARMEFHRTIQGMLTAYVDGLAPLFLHRARHVMTLGHSSGRDFLTGFLYCGNAIMGNMEKVRKGDTQA